MKDLYFSLCVFLMSLWITSTTFATTVPLGDLKDDSCRVFATMLSQISSQVSQIELQLNLLNFRAFIWISLVLSAIAALFLLVVGIIIGTYVFRKQGQQ